MSLVTLYWYLFADSKSWPGLVADIASGFLLPPAHPSTVHSLSAHCARPAAAVPGWIPLKAFSLSGQMRCTGIRQNLSHCMFLLSNEQYENTPMLHFEVRLNCSQSLRCRYTVYIYHNCHGF